MWLAEIVENKVKRLVGAFETRQAANAAYWLAYNERSSRRHPPKTAPRTPSPCWTPCIPKHSGVYPVEHLPFLEPPETLLGVVLNQQSLLWELRFKRKNCDWVTGFPGSKTAERALECYRSLQEAHKASPHLLPCLQGPIAQPARCSP
jgi:hypothetical protein